MVSASLERAQRPCAVRSHVLRSSFWLLSLWLLSLWLLSPLTAHALEVPYLSGRVVDGAGIVDGDSRQRIEARLAGIEDSLGAQVAVLTVPTLDGDPIEDFSIRVVEQWKLGRSEIDDGVLFLVVPGDRRMRIEVGYGLEPTLTDATARRILDDLVAPRFRAGDLAGGIAAGVEAIASVIEGSELPAPPPSRPIRIPIGWLLLIVIVIVILNSEPSLHRHDSTWTSGHGWSSSNRSSGGGFSGGGGSFGGGGASGSW